MRSLSGYHKFALFVSSLPVQFGNIALNHETLIVGEDCVKAIMKDATLLDFNE